MKMYVLAFRTESLHSSNPGISCEEGLKSSPSFEVAPAKVSSQVSH